MLTKELLQGNAALKDLTEDQITAITTLSQNDENTVIAQKYGEIHGQYDKLFSDVLGVQKPEGRGVKSSEFWSSEVKKLKEVADKSGNTDEIDQLKATITDLEAKIKDGKGGEAMIAKLEKERDDAIKNMESLKTQFGEKEAEWKQKYEDQKNAEILGLFSQEIAGLKFQDNIPESVRKRVIESEKKALLSDYEINIVQDQYGNKKLEYQKDGVTLTNKDNSLNPFTSSELFATRDAIKDMLATGNVQTGGGTKNKKTGTITGEIVDVGSPKDKVEAMSNIKASLRAKAIPVTDPRHQKIIDATWDQVVKPMFPEGQTVS